MKKKNAFAVTIEYILIFVLCTGIVIVCLQMFSSNLKDLFGSESKCVSTKTEKCINRNYKYLFKRDFEN